MGVSETQGKWPPRLPPDNLGLMSTDAIPIAVDAQPHVVDEQAAVHHRARQQSGGTRGRQQYLSTGDRRIYLVIVGVADMHGPPHPHPLWRLLFVPFLLSFLDHQYLNHRRPPQPPRRSQSSGNTRYWLCWRGEQSYLAFVDLFHWDLDACFGCKWLGGGNYIAS